MVLQFPQSYGARAPDFGFSLALFRLLLVPSLLLFALGSGRFKAPVGTFSQGWTPHRADFGKCVAEEAV